MQEYLHLKTVKVPLYNGNLLVILTNSTKKLESILNHGKEELFAHSYFHGYRKRQSFTVVLNFDNKHSKLTHGVISHEALHISNFIFSERGIIPDFDNDEAQAYLLGWVVDEIYKFMKKHNFEII